MPSTKKKTGRPKKAGTAQRAKESRQRRNRELILDTQRIKIPRLTPAQKRRRKKFESDNEAWIWEMFGPKSGLLKPLTRPFTSQDSEMIGNFFQSLQFGGDDLTLCSRGGGKTSRLRECITKALLSGVLRYGAYFGATDIHATKTIAYIKTSIEKSKSILTYYPEVAVPAKACATSPQKAKGVLAEGWRYDDLRKYFFDAELDFQWSAATGLLFPRTPGSPSFSAMFEAYGLDCAVRGLNWLGCRPDGIFIDDPDTPNTVTNCEQAEKVIERINFDIGGLRGEGAKMCRTMLATISKKGEGVAYRLSGPESPFVVKQHKFLIRKPDHWEMWMEYVDRRQRGKSKGDKYGREAHEFYGEHHKKMDAGAEVSNCHRFDSSTLPDGSQVQFSALQFYFDEWADKGEYFCRCELDNERVVDQTRIVTRISPSRMMDCVDDLGRKQVDSSLSLAVRGIDVRKVELHWLTGGSDDRFPNQIFDYDVRNHGTSETTVEQAESLILAALHAIADEFDRSQLIDENGHPHSVDLTLIDKGFVGSWENEEGERKQWARQPVETFCLERRGGLRRWLPAKGAPNYQSPKPSETCVVGDHWHMNAGEGKERRCTEVIWDAEHWHLLVEELFMLPGGKLERFQLFIPEMETDWSKRTGGRNHKSLGEHITRGAEVMKDQMQTQTRKRKPRFVRDHWWDSAAMMLVAQSVELWLRENVDRFKRSRPKPRPSQQRHYEEIGAR